MKQMRRVPLLVICSLLSFATSAAAECAWVLWSTRYEMATGKPVAEPTLPEEAYETKSECIEALERDKKDAEARFKQDPNVKWYFACLPDAVDPRVPKAN